METTTKPNRLSYLGGTCIEPGCDSTDRAPCNTLGHARIGEPSGDARSGRPLGERLYDVLSKHLEGTDPMIVMMLSAYSETIKGLDETILRDQLKQLRAAIDELLYR